MATSLAVGRGGVLLVDRLDRLGEVGHRGGRAPVEVDPGDHAAHGPAGGSMVGMSTATISGLLDDGDLVRTQAAPGAPDIAIR